MTWDVTNRPSKLFTFLYGTIYTTISATREHLWREEERYNIAIMIFPSDHVVAEISLLLSGGILHIRIISKVKI